MTAVRALLLLAALTPTADPDMPVETKDVAAVGQPTGEIDIGARGRFFRLETTAEPKTLLAEDILTLTVTITTTEAPQRPPRRLNLAEIPAISERFYLLDEDDLPPEFSTAVAHLGLSASPFGAVPLMTAALAPQTKWVFVYHLKPKSVDVREIPMLTFAYCDTVTLVDTPEKRWHVPYAPAIPLDVRVREAVVTELVAPDWAFRFTGGPELLAHQPPWSPSFGIIALALVVPPLLAGLWYVVWRRWNPDAARQARVRRSRAAAQALDALEQARRTTGRQRNDLVAAVVAAYLRERFDFPAAEPTPIEVRAHLRRLDLAPPLSELASRFFVSADSVRFPPTTHTEDNLTDAAVRLILAMEDSANPVTSRAPTMLLLPLLLAGIASTDADRPSDSVLADRAATAFAEGVQRRTDREKAMPHFRETADALEELRHRGVHNPTLYRNLGNVYLLADDVGRAVFAYRVGLRLAPNDPGLRAGLIEARRRVVRSPADPRFGRPPESRRPDWLPHVGTAWLCGVAVFAYTALCFLIARWWMTRRRQARTHALIALVVTILVGIVAVAALRDQRAETERPLVVIVEDGVLLMKGNNAEFPRANETPMNPGVEARLLFERDGWLQIELTGGEIGWVRAAYAVVDR